MRGLCWSLFRRSVPLVSAFGKLLLYHLLPFCHRLYAVLDRNWDLYIIAMSPPMWEAPLMHSEQGMCQCKSRNRLHLLVFSAWSVLRNQFVWQHILPSSLCLWNTIPKGLHQNMLGMWIYQEKTPVKLCLFSIVWVCWYIETHRETSVLRSIFLLLSPSVLKSLKNRI